MTDDGIKPFDVETFSKKDYVTKAPARITGSHIKPLDWKTDYADPIRFNSEKDVERLFYEISKHKNISDVIIKPDAPVCLKSKRKGLRAITHRVLDLMEAEQLVKILTGNDSIFNEIRSGKSVGGLARILENDEDGKAKYSELGARAKARFRYEVTACTSPKADDSFSAIIRPLPIKPYRYDELGMSEEFVHKCIVRDGIVIVAGATGEGKSSTLSSVIRYILENDTAIKGIFIMHEDPIEFSYDDIYSEHSLTIQSSIGTEQHINTFDDANVAAMRRSPDLALLGELRNESTVEAGVELSLTGHPVYATTHANNISAILPRLVSRFQKEVQSQKAYYIIEALRFLVAQKLIRDVNDNMFAVRETLEFTPELREHLKPLAVQPQRLYGRISEIMSKGLFGARSYEQQGKELFESGKIDEENYRLLVEERKPLSEEDMQQLETTP